MAPLSPPPLAIYLHLPWCIRKCPYCDFNSFAVQGALPEREYLDALARDLAAQAPALAGREVASVFLGGGTPSLFSPEGLGTLLAQLRTLYALAPDVEVTLEANPGTIERGRFEAYRHAGINRVSLGAQSFDAQALRVLGRIHGPDEIRRSAAELHAAGLDNFNLDLMFALPGQDRAGARADLEAALALAPAHLSHYQLTMEPGTVFAARPPPLPDEDLAWQMQQDCHEQLAAAGFAQYEVSAFARPGRQCRHNLNYWSFGDYVGAGAGAHGKLTQGQRIVRTTRPREPRRYLAAIAAGQPPGTEEIPAQDLPFEFALNALRLVDGFPLATFAAHTGLPAASLQATLEGLAARGLVASPAAGYFQPTALGRRFLNDVIEAFLPAGPRRGAPARPA